MENYKFNKLEDSRKYQFLRVNDKEYTSIWDDSLDKFSLEIFP